MMTRVSVIFIKIFSLMISQLGRFCGCSLCRGLGLVLLLLSGVLNAEMSIVGINVPDIILKKEDDKVSLIINITSFKPFQARGPNKNKFTTYRFGLADSDVVSASGGGSNPGDSLPVTELSKYLEPVVTFNQGQSAPTSKSFTLGSFSHDYQKNGGFDPDTSKAAVDLNGTFDIKLDANKLRNKLNTDPNFRLDIWVIGQDMSGGRGQSTDSQLSSIKIRKEVFIQVSQLQDIALTKQNVVGNYYEQTKTFCVYVSENPYRYGITLTDQNTGGLGLLKMKSSTGIELNYEVAVANDVSLLNAGAYVSKMQGEIAFTGSSHLNCANGPSPAVSIRVLSTEADSKPDGIYRDTITVYVEPW